MTALSSPSAARNRDPIAKVLQAHLPQRGLVLELASGTGEHVAHFAAVMPGLVFQPSDPDADSRASIDAWGQGHANIRPALALDAGGSWPSLEPVGIVCINMVHISPWSATIGLIRNAGAWLPPGGMLALYGPYRREGAHTAPSNEAFDTDLRARNPAWGIRDLEAVAELAADADFLPPEIVTMPANNLCLLFRRR